MNYPIHHHGQATLIRQPLERGFFPFPAVRVRMTIQIPEWRPEAGVEGIGMTNCCVRPRRSMIFSSKTTTDEGLSIISNGPMITLTRGFLKTVG
ncbi:MAG: hypothetical protein DRI65_12750 [Chloroflexota bacterium]|nr:MAG: hypothetical protein DRI65_12750 [Chloroflexota bacterium]